MSTVKTSIDGLVLSFAGVVGIATALAVKDLFGALVLPW